MHCSNMARKRSPQTRLALNWHLDVIAVKLTACAKAGSGALSINVAPRSLKSLLASIAFPAWCLGHDPSAQFLSVSYAQDPPTSSPAIAAIMLSPWYRQIFPTRLAPHRHAVQEFITTRHGSAGFRPPKNDDGRFAEFGSSASRNQLVGRRELAQ